METSKSQDLKYGIIYLYSDRGLLSGQHNPETIVKKFVYPMQVNWIDEPGRGDVLLVARRFNVGNIGQYATVSLSLSRMNRSGGWFDAIRHFADVLMGIADEGEGDIVLNENDFGYLYSKYTSVFDMVGEAAPRDKTAVEPSKPRGRWKAFKRRLRDLEAEDGYVEMAQNCESAPLPAHVDDDLIEDEELQEVEQLERERNMALERIKRDIVNYIARFHDDPKDLMAELLQGKVVVGRPGRVLVNGDLQIVLPEYDEMEIPMPAMCRTLYILFMKQRKLGKKGIVLKNIDECRNEIIDIYGLVKPGANESRVIQSVDNLCNPFGDSLNQMISRINRCVKNVITDKELAKQYTITGHKGEAYGIALSPEQLILPAAVLSGK